jgi:hypothetical protein
MCEDKAALVRDMDCVKPPTISRSSEAKDLVSRLERGRRYRILPGGVKTINALLLLRDLVLSPLLASAGDNGDLNETAELTSLDRLYRQLRGTMREVFDLLGIAA